MAFDYSDAAFATPLIRAVISNRQEDVREALCQGFSANLPDNRGWTPLHEAASNDERNDSLRQLLAHSSANINMQTFPGETPLFLACQNSCVKAVKLLLKHPKCNVNLANSEGLHPLHVACNIGHLEMVKLLVEFGAKTNAQDLNGYTPLHEAVSSGAGNRDNQEEVRFEICQHLLSRGADPDIIEYEGNFPFHFACQQGLAKCVELMYTSSKQRNVINFCNHDGRSPLMMAVPSLNLSVVETLLSHGANPNVADYSNVTALLLAAHTAHFEIFTTILRATSNECIFKYCTFDEERDFKEMLKTRKINSLICLAIDTEDLPFLVRVLESGIDPAVLQCPVIHAENIIKKSFTLHTPISFLLESKMCDLGEKTLDFLQTLIDHGSPLTAKSKDVLISYINPICAALVALNDCPLQVVIKCVRVLLQRGADPDEPYGRMPFAMEQACMRGCTEAVLLLLQYSNVLEPEDVIKWIEQETSSGQENTVRILLPLAPYYTPSERLLPDLLNNPKRKVLLAPQVYSLSYYCRTVIRKQLHNEIKSSPKLFQERLLDLGLPKDLCSFLRYM